MKSGHSGPHTRVISSHSWPAGLSLGLVFVHLFSFSIMCIFLF